MDQLVPGSETDVQRDVSTPSLSDLLDVVAEKGQIGVSETIDGLFKVSDQKEPFALGHRADEAVLKAVGVLKLVDHDLFEPIRVALLPL